MGASESSLAYLDGTLRKHPGAQRAGMGGSGCGSQARAGGYAGSLEQQQVSV